MNIIKTKISEILKQIIKEIFNIDLEEIKLENPPKKELWDFCFNPFILTKILWKNPVIISENLKDILINNSNFLDVTIVWPYLNFKLSYIFYTKLFLNENIKISNIWEWKTIIVDYIWINIWKPLHIWHMCTPNQGQVTCNLFKFLWYKVIWDSHIWDWWIIFWKLILAYKKWWDENKLKENTVQYLFELYVKITTEAENNKILEEQIRQEFKLLSEWNSESVKLWKKFTDYSISVMKIQLNRLNIKYDFDIWESFYEWIWLPKTGDYPDLKHKMSDIVKELIDKKIATKNEDCSVWVIFNENLKIPSCILAKKDWTHWYLASDLATIKYRSENWNPEKIIYHVDIRQELHFKQVFEIASNASWIEKSKLYFIWNWFISLKTWTISTRKWNIIKLEDLLNEAVNRAKKILLEKNPKINKKDLKEISEIIWIWAIKYEYLSKSRTTNVIFDWDKFMTFEWNSFPYVAYSYVRALNIIKKSWISSWDIISLKTNENFYKNEQVLLYKEIWALNEILIFVSKDLTHHNLILYSYNLSKNFSAFYDWINILNEKNENKKILNLKLVQKYIEIQKLIFEILAITLPTKM